MGLDGDTGGQPYVPEKNWRDNSLRLGVFTYRGDASRIPFSATTDAGLNVNIEDAHFLRTGVYASVFFQDLNVFGAYLHGTDTLNTFDASTNALLHAIEPDYHAWFTQADYVIYPWLQGSGRYETVTPADPTVQSLRIGTFNVSALVRANVKAMHRIPARSAAGRQSLAECAGPVRFLTRAGQFNVLRLLGENLCIDDLACRSCSRG